MARLTDPEIINALEKGKTVSRNRGTILKRTEYCVTNLTQHTWEVWLGNISFDDLKATDWGIVEKY